MIKNIVFVIQIILSISLTTLIFLQTNSENESRNNILSAPIEKRGWEKTMFFFTPIVLAIFLFSSIIQTLI